MEDRKPRGGEYWHGNYKGVSYKIQKWSRGETADGLLNSTCWNYYIYLDLTKINKEDAKKLWLTARANKFSHGRKMYRYYECAPLRDIELQGGITWYRKIYGLQDEKIVEIGCDYDHIWNDRTYDFDEILWDAKQTIETVIKRFPELEAVTKVTDLPTERPEASNE